MTSTHAHVVFFSVCLNAFVHLGDFFKDPLLEADLYILARILHDWTDERCVELLGRVHRACKPGW